MWILRATIDNGNGAEKIELKAPTLNGIYTKFFKILRMGIIEFHGFQET